MSELRQDAGVPSIGALLLAAGASRRLGRAKPLVRIGGRTLLRRAAEAALAAGCAPLIAVLGPRGDLAERELEGLPATIVSNRERGEGIASSIRAGVGAAARVPHCEGLLILLVDQPRIDARLLGRLLERYRSGGGSRIAACAYAGTVGAPAVFPRASFRALGILRGDRGAQALLRARRAEILELPFPDAAVDVDTPEDLAQLADRAPGPAADPARLIAS